ncbi:MAG: transposase InsO family protein [Lentisphaeria bacterium]|jgi:transposase InsO family protein
MNESYIHHENLQSASDSIANRMTALPIFEHYTIDKQAPFSSIDGQNFECRINTFKARFSSKYFRKGKVFIERFWRAVKYEEIYLNEYATTDALRKALKRYFHFYNTERPHQTFDAATP